MSLMEGKGIDGAKDRISSQWWPTLQRNWALFCRSPSLDLPSHRCLSLTMKRSFSPRCVVPVQILNFAVIPAHLRIVAVQIVSLGWK